MRSVKVLVFVSSLFFSLVSVAQSKSINGFEIPRLSPKPATVANTQQAQISLNGKWNFQIAGSKTQHTINVPGEWEMQGFTVNEGETAVYSRDLDIPADWKGKRIKIRFDGVSSHAVVKVNGVKLGEHEGSFVPFETDITSAIREGKNVLQVEVQALTVSDRLACTSQYAVHTVGGILRKATLFVLAETNIADITVNTSFDKQFKNAFLNINAVIANESSNAAPISIRYTLKDAEGKTILEKTIASKVCGPSVNLPTGQAGCQLPTANLLVKQPRQWNPEHPYLYRLTTSLLVNGKVQQTVVQNIGFRQVEIKGNQLLVNGKPIKLHGVNRHSVHPLTGRSISPELDRKDAELFREANCNYIRTSHYPPSEEFLNAADELGLFVESEASLTWIQHGASPIWKKWNYTDEKFLPYMVRADVENVLAGRNHPSIIIWSLGNESRWSPLWEKVNAVVKQLDKTRPTSFHDQCWGGYNNAGSKADIANYHYPGINGPRATDTMSRPTLFGEYAHLTTYSRRELLTDPGVRSAYNAPLVKFYDSIYHYKANLGGAIWSGIDDIFHMPDGRIVGYGPWGPLDAWRRPKPEYWGVKKAYSPVRITKVNWSTLNKGYVELTVENRYDFTSLNEIKIQATVNGVAQQVVSVIPARSKGVIKIPSVKDVRELYISFTDPRGFIAAEEKYENSPPAREEIKTVAVTYTENEAAITVQQGEVTYTISKTTGIITSARKNDQVLLTQGPVFCVVPMNSEDGGKPNVAGETYQNNIYPLKNYPLYTLFATDITTKQTNDGINVAMNTTYTNAKGKQSYLFSMDGKLVTEYEVMYRGQDTIPYQYGLLLQLPKQMDKLSWKRKGEFTTYPDNDIARNEGTTLLNAKHVNGVEEHGVMPKGDWKDDANDLGSNDFRSTKRYIKTAALQDKNGNGITVSSDGTQSSRSWFQDERINWLIADYSNNGSEPFYGSPHTDGEIKIKDKTLKGRVVLMLK